MIRVYVAQQKEKSHIHLTDLSVESDGAISVSRVLPILCAVGSFANQMARRPGGENESPTR